MATYSVQKRNQEIINDLTVDDLKRMARTGDLVPTDKIRKDGSTTWHSAEKVKGLEFGPEETIPDFSEDEHSKVVEEVEHQEIHNEAEEGHADEEIQGPLTTWAILLRILGVLCCIIAVIDFIVANLGWYDMYAGLPFVYEIPLLGYLTAIALFGVGGYLFKTGNNPTGKVDEAHKIVGWVGAIWLVVLAFTNLNLASEDWTDAVYEVKEGAFDFCPNQTVGDMVDNYMGYPTWEAFVADDGNTYVNVVGDVMYNNRNVDAALQFILYADDTFGVNALEFNGQGQNQIMIDNLLEEMCSTY